MNKIDRTQLAWVYLNLDNKPKYVADYGGYHFEIGIYYGFNPSVTINHKIKIDIEHHKNLEMAKDAIVDAAERWERGKCDEPI